MCHGAPLPSSRGQLAQHILPMRNVGTPLQSGGIQSPHRKSGPILQWAQEGLRSEGRHAERHRKILTRRRALHGVPRRGLAIDALTALASGELKTIAFEGSNDATPRRCGDAQSVDALDSYRDSHHWLFNDLGGSVFRNALTGVLQITDVGLYSIMDIMQRLLSRMSPGGTSWQCRDASAPAAVASLCELKLKEVGFHGVSFDVDGVIVLHSLK
jgi:hypothetical protein